MRQTRSDTLQYRAKVAQWKAERAARRPKAPKLAENARLRVYVQDQLAGGVENADGRPIPGPEVPCKGRRHGRRTDRRWGTCWSPEQISRRLRVDFSQDETMRISHEAIYQALYQLRIDTGLAIYFCDPRSPWQRGTKENTNGLLRQYFPKGTDVSRYSEHELKAVAATLNCRPRKTLGWKTPAEALNKRLPISQKTGVARTP